MLVTIITILLANRGTIFSGLAHARKNADCLSLCQNRCDRQLQIQVSLLSDESVSRDGCFFRINDQVTVALSERGEDLAKINADIGKWVHKWIQLRVAKLPS